MKHQLTRTCSVLAAVAAWAIATTSGMSQESTEELVKRLAGQAAQAPAAAGAPGLATRGLGNTRSFGPAAAPAPVQTETRSLILSTRGIPKAVQAAQEENTVSFTATTAVKSTGAGDYAVNPGEQAYEVSYAVDPYSKVARDNILFRKGSDEFYDEASYQVVVQLAEALRHPSLAAFKYVIEGHASAEGNAYSNQALSQRRSERIVYVLANLGVDPHRLLPIGYGETQARYPDYSEEYLLRQDRRVLIFKLEQ
jgi:outer membrane protein OmpA-like peptidoglycan-associated protein